MALTEQQKKAQQQKRAAQKKVIQEMRETTKRLGERPLYDKHEEDKNFVKTPVDLLHYLIMQPYGFTTETMYLYQIIVQWYSKKTGDAFPSQYAMAKRLCKGTSTVKRHIGVLRDLGLVKVKQSGAGRSNRYEPLRPLSVEELIERYPLAAAYKKEIEDGIDIFKEVEAERMREARAKK